MRKLQTLAAAVALACLPMTPAFAGWTLAPPGTAALVARGTLKITPGEAWNRSSARPVKKSEIWTLDGQGLNELYFVSGLVAGETLLRDVDKKNRPLPKMSAGMQLTDVPDFFESSWRIGQNTTLFEMGTVEPTQLGGHSAVKFTYRYAVQGEALTRQGIAVAALIKGQLHLINFVAPTIFYFDRDAAKAQAIFTSARF